MTTLKITQCDSLSNPREWDILGTFAGRNHRRYLIGDVGHTAEVTEAKLKALYDGGYIAQSTFERLELLAPVCFSEEHTNWIDSKFEEFYIFHNVYMYDHGNVVFSTTPFSCKWDSSLAGIIYASKSKVREEFQVKRITKKIVERIEDILKGEIETYSQYTSGDMYQFQLLDDDGNEIDSCGGFFGSDPEVNGMADYVDLSNVSNIEYA